MEGNLVNAYILSNNYPHYARSVLNKSLAMGKMRITYAGKNRKTDL